MKIAIKNMIVYVVLIRPPFFCNFFLLKKINKYCLMRLLCIIMLLCEIEYRYYESPNFFLPELEFFQASLIRINGLKMHHIFLIVNFA